MTKKRTDESTIQRCADQLLGIWVVHAEQFMQLFNIAINSDVFTAGAIVNAVDNDDEDKREPLYEVVNDTAVIKVEGLMTKKPHSFSSMLGGAATSVKRMAIREAVRDPSVKSILMNYESPGGTVAGQDEFVAEIKKADKTKPVYSYAEDFAASGAYWAGTMGRKFWANRMAQVGSIGAMVVLNDESKKFEKEGITAHAIASGKHKADFAPGTKVTPEMIAKVKERIDDLGEVFIKEVAEERGMSIDQARELGDGNVFVGQKAVDVGLIDGIKSFDEVIAQIGKETSMEMTRASLESEHPKIAAEIRDAGYDEGHKQGKLDGFRDGRDDTKGRFEALCESYAGDPAFIVEAMKNDKTLEAIRVEWTAKVEGERDVAVAKAAKLEKALQDEGHEDSSAVATAGAEDGETKKDENENSDADKDPETLAGLEWDKNVGDCQSSFSTKKRFVSVRAAELTGALRVSSRA